MLRKQHSRSDVEVKHGSASYGVRRRRWENSVGTPEFHGSARLGQHEFIPQDAQKVRQQGRSELPLPLFFSILLCHDVAHKIVQRRIGDLDLDEFPRCG